MKARDRLAAFFFFTAVAVMALGSQWLWQYSKFVNGYGLFFYISPAYGAIILTAIDGLLLIASLVWVWQRLKKGEPL